MAAGLHQVATQRVITMEAAMGHAASALRAYVTARIAMTLHATLGATLAA